eukprot:11106617-Heterocapsa_arctica.AAC.1
MDYPPVEVARDDKGNVDNIIRVDHGHYRTPLAEEDYVTVTAENLRELLGEVEHVVHMANAQCSGLALRLGLYNGINTMCPCRAGSPEEELSFMMASTREES